MHRFRNRTLKLQVMTTDYVLRPILDINVGSDAFILNRPFSVARKESTARSNCRTAIDEWGSICGMIQPTPRALAHQQTNLAVMKHIRHEVATRAGHLVNDH